MAEFRIVLTPGAHVRRLSRGERLGDDTLYEMVALFNPPLLSEEMLRALRSYLLPEAKRGRGRPRTEALTKRQVANAVATISSPDLPVPVRELLLMRLRKGSRVTEDDISRKAGSKLLTQNRNRMARWVYLELKRLIATGPPYKHSLLGELTYSHLEKGETISHKTLLATHEILGWLGYNPPSLPTLMNIVSGEEKYARKCE